MKSPDKDMKIIHVAGTNGKGSVCNYVSSILLHSGYHIGMFTSPHLVDITERFKIDGSDISEDVFRDAFCKILDIIERYNKQKDHTYSINKTDKIDEDGAGFFFPSYFEYLFFMAMIVYTDHPVDYLVLETGLGGLLDVTNTIDKPVVCVITEIGMDHMQYLGDTYEKIAAHKAGIIKTDVPVIFFDKRPESTQVIRETAMQKGARTHMISEESIKNVKLCRDDEGNKYVDFCYDSEYYNYVGLCLHTSAIYQTQNSALAISCIEELKNTGALVSYDDIRMGLSGAMWPCRMEEIRPGFIVDGAHNTDGMEAFLTSARDIDTKGRKILLFGAVSDKQYKLMASMIGDSRIFDIIAVTCLKTSRSLDMDRLTDAFKGYDNVSFYDSVSEATAYIDSIRTQDDLIFAAGSLYLAGQLRETYD
jgi:dihydrofolate synthase/folylpolyglutamate synthase